MSDEARLLDRLGRRGKMTITVEDGTFDVRLVVPGPFVGGRCTTDKHDLFEYCRLGASNWQGEGADLAALLVLCEMESRPDNHDIDDLVRAVERRRDTRTLGPPLPSFMRWYGWRPGGEWLRTFDHAHEYLAGYLRDIEVEREQAAEDRASQLRLERRQRERVRRVLEGST